MAVIDDALKRLLPKGMAWRPTGYFQDVLDALAISLGRIRTFYRGIITESIPDTADDTVESWYAMLGLAYDDTLSLINQRKRIETAYTSAGGQTLQYLNAQLQNEFPLVHISEITPLGGFEYDIEGSVYNTADIQRLTGLIHRIAPAHLYPNYDLVILNTLDTAYAGTAITGKALTGRITP